MIRLRARKLVKETRGKHVAPRRLLSATAEQWGKWDRAAHHAGMRWAPWARAVLELAARYELAFPKPSPVPADIRPIVRVAK